MGKQASQEESTPAAAQVKAEKKARRRLARAQLAWNVAQEEFAQARVKGKQAVNKARLKEARLLAKASQRLERRAAAVAEAEERLFSLIGASPSEEAVQSAEAAAELLESLADGGRPTDGAIVITSAESMEQRSVEPP